MLKFDIVKGTSNNRTSYKRSKEDSPEDVTPERDKTNTRRAKEDGNEENKRYISTVSSEYIPLLIPSTSSNIIKFPEVIELNVGGRFYTTTLATLLKYPSSLLGKMFSGTVPVVRDSAGRYFIDRDPTTFGVILDYLRTDKVTVPPSTSMPNLLEECYFYNIEGISEAIIINTNIAEQFRQINFQILRPSFDKLWPVLQKRIKMILEVEPLYVAEIGWGHKGGVHNSLHKVEVSRDADWNNTRTYIKVEISWKEDGTVLKATACVETWSRYLQEYGFRTQVVDCWRLRFFW